MMFETPCAEKIRFMQFSLSVVTLTISRCYVDCTTDFSNVAIFLSNSPLRNNRVIENANDKMCIM